MKFNNRNIIPVLLILLLAGCKRKVTQEELIDAAVAIKLAQWKESQIKECREKIIIEAEEYVDSALVATSLETKLDTIPKPEKPVKPSKPAFKQRPDSVIVDPIYKKGR